MSTYQRKYYLHRRLRPYLKVDAQKKQVSGPISVIESLPAIFQKYVKELIEAGYNVQLELPVD